MGSEVWRNIQWDIIGFEFLFMFLLNFEIVSSGLQLTFTLEACCYVEDGCF